MTSTISTESAPAASQYADNNIPGKDHRKECTTGQNLDAWRRGRCTGSALEQEAVGVPERHFCLPHQPRRCSLSVPAHHHALSIPAKAASCALACKAPQTSMQPRDRGVRAPTQVRGVRANLGDVNEGISPGAAVRGGGDARRGVHGIAEDREAGAGVPDNARADRPGVDPDPQLRGLSGATWLNWEHDYKTLPWG